MSQLFTTGYRYVLHQEQGGKPRFAANSDVNAAQQAFDTAVAGSKRIVLTTGCGLPATFDELPLRMPSMIVPGLELMRHYRETHGHAVPITYDFYQAGDFIRRVNHVEPGSEMTGRFMQGYLQNVVETFYPDLAPSVTFDFHKDVTPDQLAPVKQFLNETDDPTAMSHVQRITDYAARRPGRGDPLDYAAANIHFNLQRDQAFAEPATIIPIGGDKESPFFDLTALYQRHVDTRSHVRILPLSFSCQETPSYFPLPQDVLVSTLFGESGCDVVLDTRPKQVKSDFIKILEPAGITVTALVDVARQTYARSLVCA